MKKIYQAPQVQKVIYCDSIMEEGPNVNSYGLGGSVTGQDDTDWTPGGNGQSGQTPDAKGTGRFWDDEY